MSNRDDALRRKWISYWRGRQEAMEAGHMSYLPFPAELHDLRCGAKTRAGTPCKTKVLHGSGRCKLHGGLSTGPKTDAGKAQARENGKLGGRGRRAKPNPMNDLTKHRRRTELKEVLIAEPEAVQKPNPLREVRLRQGSGVENRQNSSDELGGGIFQMVADSDAPRDSTPVAREASNPSSQAQSFVRVSESGGNPVGSRQARWRAYCAERGIQLPMAVELSTTERANRGHIVPASRSGIRGG